MDNNICNDKIECTYKKARLKIVRIIKKLRAAAGIVPF